METTKSVEIKVPKGFIVDTFKDGVLTFKPQPKDVLERILTDEDVLADNGHTWDSFKAWCDGLEVWERSERFLTLLHNSLNEGWIADYDNDDQYKYQPRFIGGSSGFRFSDYDAWLAASNVGSRLCLKESRLAIHAGTKFTKWFKSAIII